MTKAPKFTRTTNTDGSHTVYVNGKKGFRGSPLDADSFVAAYRVTPATATTGTTTKTTASHDRITLVAKFPNGDQVRLTLTRSGETVSTSQPPATTAENIITKADLRKIMTIFAWTDGDKTNTDRFNRVAAALEAVASVKSL